MSYMFIINRIWIYNKNWVFMTLVEKKEKNLDVYIPFKLCLCGAKCTQVHCCIFCTSKANLTP